MDNLGVSYLDIGRLDEAMRLFEESLAIHRSEFGPEHPATITSMNNLAAAYQAAGRAEKAIPIFEEVLVWRKNRLGR